MESWPFEGEAEPVVGWFDMQNANGTHIGSAFCAWERLPEGVIVTVLDPKNPEDAEPGEWECA